MRIAALTSALLLGATALAAPVPKGAPTSALPPANAAVPGVLVLRPTDEGKIKVTVLKTEKQRVQLLVAGAPGGAAPPQPVVQEVNVRVPTEVDLSEVKELKVYNTAGKEVPKDDALKALAKGGVVVISGDGKPVDPGYLAAFREGTLVLVAPDLVTEARAIGEFRFRGVAVPPIALPGAAPAPALPPPPVKAPAPPK